MRATEYFEKYDQPLMEEVFRIGGDKAADVAGDFAGEFLREMGDICAMRHVTRMSGVYGVVKDQNNKWNKVVRLFTAKYGYSPFKQDGFKELFKKFESQLILTEEQDG